MPELVAEALTNDETAERTSAASPPQTSTSAASFSNSTHAPRPARRHHPRERTRHAATRSARTTNALLPTDTKASVRATVHQTLDMDDNQPSQRRRQTAASTRRSAGRGISPQAPRAPRCRSAKRSSRCMRRRRDACSGPPWPGLEQAGSPRGGSSKQQRSEATAHSCSRPRPTVEPEYGDVWFAMKAGATLAAITDACARVGGERSVGCAFGWDWRVVEPPRAGVGRVSSEGR